MFVSINYLTVRSKDGSDLSARFEEAKQHLLEAAGFTRFRLLRPRSDGKPWLVYTEWEDLAAYEAWKASPLNDRMHPHRAHDEAGSDVDHGQHPTHSGAHSAGMALGSEVVHYDVATALLATEPGSQDT